jgi:hypothetical protein
MKKSQSPVRISRRAVFGLGAATAGVVATSGGRAAFARTPDDDRSSPPTNPPDEGFGDTDSFTSSFLGIPGTELLILNAGDFAANEQTVALPTNGGAYPSGSGFLEAKIPLPGGSTIQQIDVYGYRASAGRQDWALQRYDPSNFGAANANTLYRVSIDGVGNLSESMPLPAGGLYVPPGIALAVYLADSSSTNTAWGIAVQYDAPRRRGYQPIDPVRVYDSRAASPTPGVLARNQSRVVSVTDGRDAKGAVVAPGVVPARAAAVTLNVTVTGTTGPNYLSVAPGYAASVSTSTLNWPGGFDLANGATVGLDGIGQLKVFMGDQAGSAHFIIDVTGYYYDSEAFLV